MEFVRRLGGFLMPGGRMGAVGARRQAAPVFDPFSLGWEAAHWASDPMWSNPGDGNAVSSWRDGAGHGHTLTQSTPEYQPLYRNAVASLGGKPGVDFDGTNDYLKSDAFSFAQPMSIVMIVSGWVAGGGNRYLFGSGPPPSVFMRGESSSALNVFAGTILGASLSLDSGGHVYRGFFNGASSVAAKDAATVSGEAGPDGIPSAGFAIGAYAQTGIAGWADINVAFVGVSAGDITANPNWAAFKTWVTSFYGITV